MTVDTLIGHQCGVSGARISGEGFEIGNNAYLTRDLVYGPPVLRIIWIRLGLSTATARQPKWASSRTRAEFNVWGITRSIVILRGSLPVLYPSEILYLPQGQMVDPISKVPEAEPYPRCDTLVTVAVSRSRPAVHGGGLYIGCQLLNPHRLVVLSKCTQRS